MSLERAAKSVSMLVGLLLMTGLIHAQQKKLKVLISADMEGIGGVNSWDVQTDPKGHDYEKFRRLMTEEVNAAIAGATAAGATDLLVVDSHNGQDIDNDSTFDAAVFVGYHAREGAADAVLAHTDNGRVVVKLNGVEVPEAGFEGAIAGDFGVPVVFLSGDQTACHEARELLGPIEIATVKHDIGFYSAEMLPPGGITAPNS